MDVLILDRTISSEMISKRQELGHDRYDEVWDGVYVMSPMANNEHQRIVAKCCSAILDVVGEAATVLPGANVSDRNDDWVVNYRCPDVVVVLPGCTAIDRTTHWQGGPDFLIEVRSRDDDTYKKLSFYAGLGVREVLVVERDSRLAALYRLGRTKLSLVKPTEIDGLLLVASRVLPLAFRTVIAKSREPRLEVRRTAGRKKTWLI